MVQRVTPQEKFMREAIRQSQLAVERGSFPYGAVLVYHDEIILAAHNTVLIDRDITAHAELNLVRQAYQKFSPDVIANSVLYTSTESCAMCAGAIYWAAIPAVVFGCPTELDSAISAEPFAIPSAQLFAQVTSCVGVIGPFLQDESVAVLEPFWRSFLMNGIVGRAACPRDDI